MCIHLVQCDLLYSLRYTTQFGCPFLGEIRVICIPPTKGDSLVSIHDRSLFLMKMKGRAHFSHVGPFVHLHTPQKFIVDYDKCLRTFHLYRGKPSAL
jgi:hypothetical protein